MKFLIILIISCICLLDSVNSKSKYYDGPDRAYKFGYSIEGNQHRQESKDENGIIMGEFGFITADGVYHVTGYGTDENGNFKILYMKNIKIGLPGEPGQEPAPKNLGGQPQSPPAPKQIVTAAPPPPPPPPSRSPIIEAIKQPKASDIVSCGSCIIPEIEKEVNEVVKQQISPGANSIAQAPRKTSQSIGQSPGNSIGSPAKSSAARQGKALDFEKSNSRTNDANSPKLDLRSSQNESPSSSLSSRPGLSSSSSPQSSNKQSTLPGKSNVKSPQSEASSRPTSNNQISSSKDSSNDIKIASSNRAQTDNSNDGGGTSSKIPLDLSRMQNIINGILYKFNYTVGYHGHHEQGDQIGNKDGGYFSVGRDGYRRTVDYTANENGFQPYIKLRQADENEIPKPDTEKEAGLKGYEFKWFNLGDDTKTITKN